MSESVLALFSTDKDSEKKGKWIDIGPASFLLARAGGANTKFQKAISTALRPHQRRIQMGVLDEAEAEKLAVEPFVDAVLLNWKNVRAMVKDEVTGEMKVGDEIPYSKDNAKRVLSDHPDLFKFLMEESTRLSNFAPDFVDAATGN